MKYEERTPFSKRDGFNLEPGGNIGIIYLQISDGLDGKDDQLDTKLIVKKLSEYLLAYDNGRLKLEGAISGGDTSSQVLNHKDNKLLYVDIQSGRRDIQIVIRTKHGLTPGPEAEVLIENIKAALIKFEL